MSADAFSVVSFSHTILCQLLEAQLQADAQKTFVAFDATVGNGHDTLFLCQLLAKQSRVIGCDIQESAIQACTALLDEHQYHAELSVRSHAEIRTLCTELGIEQLDVVMYNLGYLPGGDKSLRTQAESTITSLDQALRLLNRGGMISICCYVAHDGGVAERDAVLQWLQTLDETQYRVVHYRSISTKLSPECFVLQKKS